MRLVWIAALIVTALAPVWAQFSTLPKRATGLLVVEEDGEGNRTTHSYRESRVNGASLSDGRLQRFFQSPQSVSLPGEAIGSGDLEPSPVRGAGYVLENGDGESRLTEFSIGANGTSTRVIDAEGVQTDYFVDEHGNLLQALFASGHRIDMSYDNRGNVISKTDYLTSAITEIQYHPVFNKPTAVIHSTDGNPVTIVEYDTRGNPASLRTPLGRLYQSEYDEKGMRSKFSTPEGGVIQYDYDSQGNLDGYTLTADGVSRTYSLDRDTAGRVTVEKLPESYEIAYAYHADGALASIVEPGGAMTEFAVNGNGPISAMDRPGGARHEWEYNDRTELAVYRRPGLVDLIYRYNAFGDLKGVEAQGTQLVGFVNNDNGDATSAVFSTGSLNDLTVEWNRSSTTGALLNVVSSDGITTTPSYEGEALSGLAWTGVVAGTANIGIDEQYRVLSVQLGSEVPVTYEYDADGFLIRAGEVEIAYVNNQGTLDTITMGVVEEEFTINGFGEIERQIVVSGSQEVFRADYVRDALGRITRVTEVVEGVETVLEYRYDSTGRLASVSRNDEAVESYSYDERGNLVADHLNANYVYNAADQLLSAGEASFAYAPGGELSSRQDENGTTEFHYTHASLLRGVDLANGDSVRYLHDGALNRSATIVGGDLQETYICLSGNRPEARVSKSGDALQRFVYGRRAEAPLYFCDNSGSYRLIVDHRGSVRLVVSTATGAIIQRLDYDAYGKKILDTNPGFQPFGFAGGWWDSKTGLLRFGARDYDPEYRRWTTPDPIGLFSGQLNDYGYVDGDPINLVDSMGLEAERGAVGQLLYVGKRHNDGYHIIPEPVSNIYIKRLGSKYEVRLYEGDKIFKGDIITAGDGTLGVIEFFIGGQARISGTAVEILGDRDFKVQGNQFLLKAGVVWAKTSGEQKGLQLDRVGGINDDGPMDSYETVKKRLDFFNKYRKR